VGWSGGGGGGIDNSYYSNARSLMSHCCPLIPQCSRLDLREANRTVHSLGAKQGTLLVGFGFFVKSCRDR